MKKILFFTLVLFMGVGVFLHPFQEKTQSPQGLKIDRDRLLNRMEKLAQFGIKPGGGVSRVAFSEEDIQSRHYLKSLMEEAGLEVRVDAAGNIIGRREGDEKRLPALMTGSHSDTVPLGGMYDGSLGVLGAVECAQVLHEKEIPLRHPLEVVVFVDEERGLIGSKAMIGALSEEALQEVSHSGKTVRQGIIDLGGRPDRLEEALREKDEIEAFVELHIEQGRVLEKEDKDIGIVEGIVGIQWWNVTVKGVSNHAGTTPMDERKDALLAAARLIVAVNQVVHSVPGSQVGTVGRIKAEPGAPNVIPGRVTMSLELRDLSSEKIQMLFQKIKKEAQAISKKTGTQITFTPIEATAVPAPTDPQIQECIAQSAEELGLSYLRMPSGAGHDAQDMAKMWPTGMIFIPSVGGVSHSPKEYSRPQDVVNGVNTLLHTLLKLDHTSPSADTSD